jgi:hypothetical protein
MKFYRITKEPEMFIRETLTGKWELLNNKKKVMAVYVFEPEAKDAAIERAKNVLKVPRSISERLKIKEQQYQAVANN